MFKGSKNAFTLAEVLITLGIIGVVAAMTMPTLLNSTQAARSKTGFKKVMNVLNQALVVNFALEDFDASAAASGTGEGSLYNIFMTRTNVMKTAAGYGKEETSNVVLFFNDGMTFSFNPNKAVNCGAETGSASNKDCSGMIDTIGGPDKGPGKLTETVTGTGNTAKVKTEDIGDRWAVRIERDKVLPANEAARLIMYNK